MKAHTTTQQFKTPETEEEYGGKTMTPPQFKFADSSDASERGSQRSNEDASAMEDAGNGGYTEQVSNFAIVTKKILEWGQNQDDPKLFLALEALKHDAKEVAQFKAYFQTKVGKSLEAYLGQWFSSETAANILDNGFIGAQGVSATDLADVIHKKIVDGDPDRIASSLLGIPKPSEVAAAYREAYQSDLKADLLASAPEGSALAEMVHNVFGDTQNFEKVKVNNEAEATEARAIIARIFDVYGVDVNSQKALEVARTYFQNVPEELQKQLHTECWTVSALKDLEISLSKYGPISGANRSTSTRSGDESQGVTTVGRINNDISSKGGTAKLGGDSGVFYPKKHTVAILDNAVDYNNSGRTTTVKGANGKTTPVAVKDSMIMVISHELGHGFLEYAEDDFQKSMGYWKADKKGVGLKKRKVSNDSETFFEVDVAASYVEAPPTKYGASSHVEDLAESVSLYFNDNARMRRGKPWFQKLSQDYQRKDVLGGPCPERMEFIQRTIAKWKSVAQPSK